jgi:hypothetical protein
MMSSSRIYASQEVRSRTAPSPTVWRTHSVGLLEVEDEVELADLGVGGGGGWMPSVEVTAQQRACSPGSQRALTLPKYLPFESPA